MLRLAVSCAVLSATSSAQPGGGNVIEFEMEPMGPGEVMDAPPPELLKMMGFDVSPPASPIDRLEHKPAASSNGKSNHAGHSSSSKGEGRSTSDREDQLDRALRSMLGDMDAAGPQGTLVLEGPDGQEVVVEGGMPPPMTKSPKSRMPVEAFHGLFPGPLAFGSPAEMDAADVVGFGGPDPMVMDMLQDMSQAFQEQMLPAIHAAASRAAPQACIPDLKKHCGTARSQLHCLGQHAGDISNKCRDDVGKSVPFLCSTAIDRFCDIMQSGILSCLEKHVNHIDGPCKDSVLATQHVIKTASNQKAALVQHAATASRAQGATLPLTAHLDKEVASAKPSTAHLGREAAAATAAKPSSSLRSSSAAAGTVHPSSQTQPGRVAPKSGWEWLHSSIGARIIFLTLLVGAFAYLIQSLFQAAWLRAEGHLLRSSVELPKSCEVAL